MPDQQLERFVGSEVFDTKSQEAVDQSFFEAPGSPMEKKLQRDKHKTKKEEWDREYRADETVIPARFFFIKYLIDVVGDIRKTLHDNR